MASRSLRQASQDLDDGVINSASATLELRPGDQLELTMTASEAADRAERTFSPSRLGG